MAVKPDFHPRDLVEDPVRLAEVSDAADASALKLQRALHRQRVGAARARLRRSKATGASEAEIASLMRGLERREARLAVVGDAFVVANVKKPQANPDTAQVFGIATGEADRPPLTAALLGPSGEILATDTVAENGSFLLSAGGGAKAALVQVSDREQQVLYRDAEPEDIAAGEITYRQVALSGPIPKPAPPPTELKMPDLVGQTEEAACAILFRLGVRDIELKRRPAPGPSGLVIEQHPLARAVLVPSEGAQLIISEPEETQKVKIPDLVGRDIREASAEAKRLGLEVAVSEKASEEPKGRVLDQDPKAGTEVTLPATLKLVASSGPDDDTKTVEVPAFVGRQIEEVASEAKKLGLELTQSPVPSGRSKGTVLTQSPAAGTQVRLPATVKVEVSTGEQERLASNAFTRSLAAAMAQDDRLAGIGLDERSVLPVIMRLEIADKEQGREVTALDNEALRAAAGLVGLAQARTFRAILRVALQQVD